MALNNNIVWPEVFARLPWVRRLKKARKCTAFKSGAPGKLYRRRIGNVPLPQEEYDKLREKWACKNSARWSFRALKGQWSAARDGSYCWKHLIHRGVMGTMDEEARTLRWLERNMPDIFKRMRPEG